MSAFRLAGWVCYAVNLLRGIIAILSVAILPTIFGELPVVTFTDVQSEHDGRRAEHAWTEAHFPGYRWKSLKLVEDAQLRFYDHVTLVNKSGEKRSVYFDITDWRHP